MARTYTDKANLDTKSISQVIVPGNTLPYGFDASFLEGNTLNEVIAKAKSAGSFAHFEVVDTLPNVDKADSNVIYLVASINGTGDSYDEYIVVNGA